MGNTIELLRSFAEANLCRKRPWPNTSDRSCLAEAILARAVRGRSRPWPKPSLAEAVLGRSCLAEVGWPTTSRPKTSVAEAIFGRSHPWSKPSLAGADGRSRLAEAGPDRSRLVASGLRGCQVHRSYRGHTKTTENSRVEKSGKGKNTPRKKTRAQCSSESWTFICRCGGHPRRMFDLALVTPAAPDLRK